MDCLAEEAYDSTYRSMAQFVIDIALRDPSWEDDSDEWNEIEREAFDKWKAKQMDLISTEVLSRYIQRWTYFGDSSFKDEIRHFYKTISIHLETVMGEEIIASLIRQSLEDSVKEAEAGLIRSLAQCIVHKEW
jgi:hypothetical protein